jgi:hypothetical protein
MNTMTSDQLLIGSGIAFIFLSIVGRLILPKIGLQETLTLFARCSLAIVGLALLSIGFYSSAGLPAVMASKRLPVQRGIRVADAFYPGGWMGDYGDIKLESSCSDLPDSRPACVKISYSAARAQGKGWAGIYWLYPDKNWGSTPEGRDLRGAKKLLLWAKGDNGGERAEFKVGGVSGKYADSLQPALSIGPVFLSQEWQKFTIDLEKTDLSHVIGGFCWVTNEEQNPHGSVIYVADMQFVP